MGMSLRLVLLVAGVCGSRVETLLQQMVLEEKLGQMTMVATGFLMNRNELTLNATKVDYYIKQCKVGSLFNDAYHGKHQASPTSHEWVPIINQIQAAYQETRLKIPVIHGLDSVHGANNIGDAVIFPHQLGLAASFNRTLVRSVAQIAAKDSRAIGVHWNFSPNLEVGVNKQWSRLYETFGEDPFLVSEMGAEMVHGYQGTSLRANTSVAATMKHFIGYSAVVTGKNYDGVWMHDRTINNYFRPPFQRAIRAGAAAAMSSHSDLNGDAMVTSKRYLQKLLREEMGFQGALSSDFAQIANLHTVNHVASSTKEALRKAIPLIDFNMAGFNADSIPIVKELVEAGLIPESSIDSSVRRILELKEKVGLLDSTGMVDINRMKSANIGGDVQAAIDAAGESIVLLQNDILPLSISAKILLTGPSSNTLRHLAGGWSYSWLADPNDDVFHGRGVTVLQGLQNMSSHLTHVEFDVDAVLASQCDAIVVCLGEEAYTEMQGDMDDMNLPKEQLDFLDAIIERSTKPVIVVLSEGRPRTLRPSIRNASAVLVNFLTGPYSGQAIANIIFGKTNPSAKLSITYANHPNANNLNYYRLANEAYTDVYWEFGHGLSYTTFQYSSLQLSSASISPQSTITATVTVTNTGKVPGAEVVLFYITDIYRSVVPETKKLRQFHKVHLQPKESQTVTFKITGEDLAFYNIENVRVIEEGDFTLAVATLSVNFTLAFPVKDEEGMFPYPELS